MRKVPLPDGSKLNLYTAALTALAAGAMSNAAHAVVTVANTLVVKAVVVITSEDYPELEGRVARVKAVTADSVTLDGVDTSDLAKFPMGGSVALIPLVANEWQRLPYVPTFGLSGGELKTGGSSYLDVEDEQEFSQGRSARRLEYTNSWKQDGAARAALKASDGLESVHRLDFKDGSASYYVGELAYDDVPSTEKGSEMTTKSTVLLRGAPPLRPCIELEAAVSAGAGRLTCSTDKRTSRTREAITGLVARGVLGLNDGFLWMA